MVSTSSNAASVFDTEGPANSVLGGTEPSATLQTSIQTPDDDIEIPTHWFDEDPERLIQISDKDNTDRTLGGYSLKECISVLSGVITRGSDLISSLANSYPTDPPPPFKTLDEIRESEIFDEKCTSVLNGLFDHRFGKDKYLGHLDSTIRNALKPKEIEDLRNQIINDPKTRSRLETEMTQFFETINNHYRITQPLWGDKPESKLNRSRLYALEKIGHTFHNDSEGHTVARLFCEPMKSAIRSTQDKAYRETPKGRSWERDHPNMDVPYTIEFTGRTPTVQPKKSEEEIIHDFAMMNYERLATERSTHLVRFRPSRITNPKYLASLAQSEKASIDDTAKSLATQAIFELREFEKCMNELQSKHYEEWLNKPDVRNRIYHLTEYQKQRVYDENHNRFWYGIEDRDFSGKIIPDLEPDLIEELSNQLCEMTDQRIEENMNGIGLMSNLYLKIDFDPSKVTETPKGPYIEDLRNKMNTTLDDDCITFKIASKDEFLNGLDETKTTGLFRSMNINDSKYFRPGCSPEEQEAENAKYMNINDSKYFRPGCSPEEQEAENAKYYA